jgi:hypothetical protein
MNRLARGDFDAYVSMDSFGAQERMIPAAKISASDTILSSTRTGLTCWRS